MKWITVKKLQSEFGLSFAAAERIIQQQRRRAWKRYWPLTLGIWVILLSQFVLIFTDLRLPQHADLLRSVSALALLSLQLCLVHRASREPILEAARAQTVKTPFSDAARSTLA